jgi:hypothetical protein
MAKIKLKYRNTESGNYRLTIEEFHKFRASLLGMGDIPRGQTTDTTSHSNGSTGFPACAGAG